MFVPLETPGGIIWIQLDGSEDGTIGASAFQERTFSSFQDTAAALRANAQYLQALIAELGPSRIEISFGITAGIEPGPLGSTGSPIFALASGPENSSYRVKIVWEDKGNDS